jgi:ribosome-associated protein
MVEGRWPVNDSQLFSEEQKQRIREKLANKITDEGVLLVKSQTERSQLGNKAEVIRKMNQLVTAALVKQKIRRPTKPTRAAQEKRIDSKKKNTVNKQLRRKINKHDYL